MNETTNLTKTLETSTHRQFLALAVIAYFVFVCLFFLGMRTFFISYLGALSRSQSYSLAIQEWRQVANGISGGWNLTPALNGICVLSNADVLFENPTCPPIPPIQLLSGTYLAAQVGPVSIRGDLAFSLWWLALVLPVIGFVVVWISYQIFKKPITRKLQVELLRFLQAFDSEKKKSSDFESELRTQAEELLRLREDAAMSSLARQVAHDIRSPLSALNIAVSVLKDLPANHHRLIKDATERISKIADDLLERGKLPDSTEREELFEILSSILFEKQLELGGKFPGICLTGQFDTAKGVSVSMSKTDLQRIISNLINNAAEAIEKKGEIELHTDLNDRMISIKIRDTGKGILPAILEKLGQLQISHGKAGTSSGSGIGVLHAKKQIEIHSGHLRISSNPGFGTLVDIQLPFKSDA